MISIPYWWNNQYSSFVSTIYATRPDLFQSTPQGKPIPSTPPSRSKEIETSDISLLSATNWEPASMDPKGWWLSEKFDGVRVYWDGNTLFSRVGREIKVPKEWADQLPKGVALDGELWYIYKGKVE